MLYKGWPCSEAPTGTWWEKLHISSGRTHSKDQRVATENSSTDPEASEGVTLAVEHGLVIRRIWLRILTPSHANHVHSFVYSCFRCHSHAWYWFGLCGDNSNQTQKEHREATCFISLSFSAKCKHLISHIYDETRERERSLSGPKKIKKIGNIWLEFPF